MATIIAKIDIRKLLKEYYFEGKEKDGKRPLYADIVLMENRGGPDRFGNDYMVVQGVSMEARKAGTKGPIIGNAKAYGDGSRASGGRRNDEPTEERVADTPYRHTAPTPAPNGGNGDSKDIPF